MTIRLSAVGRGFSVLLNAVVAVTFISGSALVLFTDMFDVNLAVRGGIAAFVLGRGLASLVLLIAHIRPDSAQHAGILRSYVINSYGYMAAGVLVGIGAMWSGGVGGFIAAYAAFSVAWFWFWARKKLWEAERSAHSPSVPH